MANFDEDKIFDSLAIRNTSLQTSGESRSGEFLAKTIFIMNGLNQAVTLQLQGARNGVWLDIGATTVVALSTNTYVTVSDYFPKYRMTAICAVSPTTGTLEVWCMKAMGG
jgi:hypothetical protein